MKAAASGGSEGSGGMSNEGSGDSGGSEPVVRTMNQWFGPVHIASKWTILSLKTTGLDHRAPWLSLLLSEKSQYCT